jgi:hypothetical protein
VITTRVDTSSNNFLRLVQASRFNSPTELADHLGIHYTTLYRWLAGTGRIPVVIIRYLELMNSKEQS